MFKIGAKIVHTGRFMITCEGHRKSEDSRGEDVQIGHKVHLQRAKNLKIVLKSYVSSGPRLRALTR